MNANNIVQKLWRLCAILRKDGITYQQYVTELTYLLFLKMMQEQSREDLIPVKRRWRDLADAQGVEALQLYKSILIDLGNPELRVDKGINIVPKKTPGARPLPRIVLSVFANASTFLREPANLKELVDAIDKLHWFSEERDQFGDLYEGLLQKNAEETKRGAGQYFTPRVLIRCLVDLMQPQPGEIIQDPATGTGGFLIAADAYMKARTDDYFDLSETDQTFQRKRAFHGLENVRDTYRLLLMNLYLHDLEPDHIGLGNTLADAGKALPKANLILTNPPFGPSGGKPARDDLVDTVDMSSFQLPFVEHCLRRLQPGGRAAIVIPDNVLFEGGRGLALRRRMMNWCRVHTILRLPTGIFYAQGVKTNVIFLERANDDDANRKIDATTEVAIYDLRTKMPQFGKTNPLTRQHLVDFEKAYGSNPNGHQHGPDEGEEGRFRKFSREGIAARGDSLDITWLREDSDTPEDGLTEPDEIANAIMKHLRAAMIEIEALQDELAADEVAG
jgi:type I restriction enzyme M protein